MKKIFERTPTPGYILGTFIVASVTLFGGTKYIFMMSSWNAYKIRTTIEGDFPINKSHHYETIKFGENKEHTEYELMIDDVIKTITIVIELNMVTTALSILTTLGLFCVMSKSMTVNKERRNAVLPYLIWNCIAILYNIVALVFISIYLEDWIAKLVEITIGMSVTIGADFLFLILITFYYRYLCRVRLSSSPALLLRYQNGEISARLQTADVDEVAIPEGMLEEIFQHEPRRLSIQKLRIASRKDSTF